jgi:hypothetical protein
LERKRNCGFLSEGGAASSPVWARRGVVLYECPVSYISGKSKALLEEYAVWKAGGGELRSLPTKTAEAILLLENETIAERESD